MSGRPLAYWGAQLAVAGQVLVFAAVSFGVRRPVAPLSVAVLCVNACAAFVVFRYMRALADRVPSPPLVAWAITVQWGWAALLAFGAGLAAIAALRVYPPFFSSAAKLDPLAGSAAGLLPIAGIPLFVGTVVFASRFVTAIRIAIDNAKYLAEKRKQRAASGAKPPISA